MGEEKRNWFLNYLPYTFYEGNPKLISENDEDLIFALETDTQVRVGFSLPPLIALDTPILPLLGYFGLFHPYKNTLTISILTTSKPLLFLLSLSRLLKSPDFCFLL